MYTHPYKHQLSSSYRWPFWIWQYQKWACSLLMTVRSIAIFRLIFLLQKDHVSHYSSNSSFAFLFRMYSGCLQRSWVWGFAGSEVTQSCPTLCDPMDCSLPGSSIYGIFQAGILEWVAISFSRRSSQPRDWTRVSHILGRRFTIWGTREVCRPREVCRGFADPGSNFASTSLVKKST